MNLFNRSKEITEMLKIHLNKLNIVNQ